MSKVNKHGYDQLSDPARIKLNHKKDQLYLACCHCSLVHHVSFKVEGDDLVIRMRRNEKETRALRKTSRRK